MSLVFTPVRRHVRVLELAISGCLSKIKLLIRECMNRFSCEFEDVLLLPEPAPPASLVSKLLSVSVKLVSLLMYSSIDLLGTSPNRHTIPLTGPTSHPHFTAVHGQEQYTSGIHLSTGSIYTHMQGSNSHAAPFLSVVRCGRSDADYIFAGSRPLVINTDDYRSEALTICSQTHTCISSINIECRHQQQHCCI